MNKDRVDWLKNAAKENGFSYDMIAEQLGKDRTTIWRWFNSKQLSNVKMKQIADVIGVDLRQHFEGFEGAYNLVEKKDYQIKYYELLEKHHMLLEELSEYKSKKD